MAEHRTGLVAVVDDDPAVLDSLRLLLEVAGHRVAIYASATSFLDDCLAQPACLILDYHMPYMSGLELAERLCVQGVRVPVLLITSSPSAALLARATRLGIEKVLEKPPDEAELLNFVAAHY